MSVHEEHLNIKVTTETKKAEAELAGLKGTLKSVDGEYNADININVKKEHLAEAKKHFMGMKSEAFNFNQQMKEIGNIASIIKFPALIEGINLAAQGVGALGGGAVALGSALAPLSGLVTTLPGLFTAFGGAMLGTKLAITGVGEALKASIQAQAAPTKESVEAMRTALSKLSPEAQTAVKDLMGLRTTFEGMKKGAQQGFFGGLGDALPRLQGLASPVGGFIREMAQAVGTLVREGVKLLTTPPFSEMFHRMLSNAVSSFKTGADGLVNIGKGILYVVDAARSLNTSMSGTFSEMTKSFADWAKAGNESGRFAAYFERTRTVVATLKQTFGGLWEALKAVGQAARPLGEALLTAMGEKSQALGQKAAQNVQKMQGYFTGLMPVLREMAGVIKDAFSVLFSTSAGSGLADVLKIVRSDLIPAFATFKDETAGALGGNLVKMLSEVIRLFTTLNSATSGTMGIVNIVTQLAKALNSLLTTIPGLKELTSLFLTWKTLDKALNIGGIFTKMSTGIMGTGTTIKGTMPLFDRMAISLNNFAGSGNKVGAILGKLGPGGIAMVAAAGLMIVRNAADEAEQMASKLATTLGEKFTSSSLNKVAGQDVEKGKYDEFMERQRKLKAEYDQMYAEQDHNLAGRIFQNPFDWKYNMQMVEGIDKTGALLSANNKVIDQANAIVQKYGVSKDAAIDFILKQKELKNEFNDTGAAVESFGFKLNSMTDAEKQAAQHTQAFNDALNDLTTSGNEVAAAQDRLTAAQKSAASAEKSRQQALKSLQGALKNLAAAQRELQEAMRPATAEEWARAELNLRSARLQQAEANKALIDMNKKLAQSQQQVSKVVEGITDDFTGKTLEFVTEVKGEGRDFAQEALDREAALINIEQANWGVVDAEKALNDVRLKGSELDPRVIAAREQLASATDGVTAAQEAYNDAMIASNDAMAELAAAQEELATKQLTFEAQLYAAMHNTNIPLMERYELLSKMASLFSDNSVLAAAIAKIIFSGQGFNDSAGMLAGSRADGGPVWAGREYNVGEKGVERFVPNTNGYIIPNDRLGGSSARDLEAIVERIAEKMKPVQIEQTFNEKADPALMAGELAWRLG